MKTLVVGFVSAACALSLGAEEVAFPQNSGTWDMMTAANWPGETLPGTTDDVKFTSSQNGNNYLTITASADGTFGALLNGTAGGYNRNLRFDLTGANPVRKMKFNGYSTSGTQAHIHTFFKGGEYDFSGQDFGKGGSKYGDNRLIRISDGCVMTNASDVVLGYTAQIKQRLEIVGGSKFFATGKFKFSNNADRTPANYSGNESWLKIEEGSYAQFGSIDWETGLSNVEQGINNQPDGQFFYRDYLIVDNSTLKTTTNTYQWMGSRGGNATIIKNGGYASFAGQLVLGVGYGRNNLLRVEGAGSELHCSTFYDGWSGPSSYNRFEVLDGATASVSAFNFGYASHSDTILVSNATLNVSNGFEFGHTAGSTNLTMILSGPQAVFNYTGKTSDSPVGKYIQFPKDYGTIVVENGAVFRPQDTFGWTQSQKHCRLIARTGGTFRKPGDVSLTQENPIEGFCGIENAIIAENGGHLEFGSISARGSNCVVRVDNSTALVTNVYIAASVCSGKQYGGWSTNCAFEVAGARPVVEIPGTLYVKNASRLVFELPADGYADGFGTAAKPLVKAGTVNFQDALSTLEIAGAADYLEANAAKDDVCLVSAETLTIPDATLAAAKAALPSGLKLRRRTVDGRVCLFLCGKKGMTLFIR